MSEHIWKLSAGTACVVGHIQLKIEVLPTTAYVMLGEKCANSCRFCAQSARSQSRPDLLSRITWREVDGQAAAESIGSAYRQGKLRRACLQVVRTEDHWTRTTEAIGLLHTRSAVPLCVSSDLESIDQVRELIDRGADRVCIALDVAAPELYHPVKGGEWLDKWGLLTECAATLPGHIVTHLIVGLGETEQQMIDMLVNCRKHGIGVGLFAFTPVRGTELEKSLSPDIGQYRRVQLARFLLQAGYPESVFYYTRGRLTAIDIPVELLTKILAGGDAFRTSGCPDCNRPYYNERPGGVMYNYPRPLTSQETARALAECALWEAENDGMALGNTGINAAATNMAMDEALLISASDMPPTLRLYGWRPAAVSVGYFQKAETEIDFTACRKRGLDIVRRMTGGRAVLHDAELTYSITVREDHPLIPKTIAASYLLFSNCLLVALRDLGVEAQLSMPRSAYSQRGRAGRIGSAACFDAPSHYEITAAGRKLVGSAQVRKNGVLLQHGSILLDFSPDTVAAALRLPEHEAKIRLAAMLAKRATSLKEQLGRTVTWLEVATAISKAFGPTLNVNLIPGDMTAREKMVTRELSATKYSQDSWNRLR